MVQATAKRNSKNRKSGKGDGPRSRPGAAEWALGVVSAVLVAAMIAFLAYHGLAGSVPKPEIEVIVESVEQRGGAYYVGFRALNRGEATAAEVNVEGRLMDGGRIIGTSQATLDYVPPRSDRRGGLLFRQDPRTHRLELEAKGYREP